MSFHLAYHDTFKGRSGTYPRIDNIPKDTSTMTELTSSAESANLQAAIRTSRSNNHLSMKQKFDLMELVRKEYVAKRLTDTEFATYAAERLGVRITAGNVSGARDAFQIPSSREMKIEDGKADLEKRVSILEARLASSLELNSQLLARLAKVENTIHKLILNSHHGA